MLAFYKGWEDRKTCTHTETLDLPTTSCTNLVNFSAVTVNSWDVVLSFQKVGGCTQAKIRTFVLFPPVYRLTALTKLAANVERLVRFITVYSNCDGLIKGRCYGNRFMARVGEN